MNLDLGTEPHWLDEFEKRFRPDGASLSEVLATEEDEQPLDFWADSEWFTGPQYQPAEQAEQAEETFEAQTEGSPASFQAAEAATIKRWFAEFDNGRIPQSALDPIGAGHFLRADAADAFKAMKRAARKDGVTIGITDSYRDYDTQVRLAQEKGLYSQGGLAAEPGTSEHGWGLATDLALSPEAQKWMNRNARKFGFNTIPREPWHWEYRGGGDYVPKRAATKQPRGIRAKPPTQTLTTEALVEEKLPLNQSLAGVFLSLFDDPTVIRRRTGVKEVDKTGLGGLKRAPAKLRPFFRAAHEATGLPVGLLIAVAKRESSFAEDILQFKRASSAGAVGPMQVMPLHQETYGSAFMRDLRANVIVGAKILASYISGLGTRRGLAAYNAGPNAEGQALQRGLSYADEVLEMWRS